MNKITQLLCLLLASFLFVACAETPTKDNQPEFAPKNFLDRALQNWPTFLTSDTLSMAKMNAAIEIKRSNYKGQFYSTVVNDLLEMGLVCVQGQNDANYVNCDYCSIKEEILRHNYSLFNKYIVAGTYWNVRLIPTASGSDIEGASIGQISIRLSVAFEQSIGGYENKVGFVSDEQRQMLCENAKNTLYDGVDLFDIERQMFVY